MLYVRLNGCSVFSSCQIPRGWSLWFRESISYFENDSSACLYKRIAYFVIPKVRSNRRDVLTGLLPYTLSHQSIFACLYSASSIPESRMVTQSGIIIPVNKISTASRSSTCQREV